MPITRKRTGAIVLALSMSSLWCRTGAAHGGIPRADLIVTAPNDPNTIVARSPVWGLYVSRDGGGTWSWVCAEAFGMSSTTANRYAVRVLPDGRIFVAAGFKGLQRSDAAGCEWSVDPFFEAPATCGPDDGCIVSDLHLSADGTMLTALTSTGFNGSVTSTLWQSNNGGESWAAFGAALPADFSSSTVLFSPSNPSRIYVSGKHVGQQAGIVYRSDDSGMTWTQFTAVGASDGGTSSWVARLAGIRPNGDGTDTVYFWVDYNQAATSTMPPPDVLYVSVDNGENWAELFAGQDDLPGFALSPDGTSVVVSGPGDGAWKAAATAAATTGQSAFQSVLPAKTWDVEWTESGLLVGTDDFASDLSTLVRSTTGEAPFEPTLVICDADISAACPESSTVGQICPKVRNDNASGGGYDTDILSSERCTNTGSADAGEAGADGGDVPDDEVNNEGSCSCRVGRQREVPTFVGLLVAWCLAAAGIRRARRRPAR